MILSFKDKATADVFNGVASREARKLPAALHEAARRKLDMLNAAADLQDLSALPANRLEKLKGDRAGFYSIRINHQYRVVFDWNSGHPRHVQIVDYH